MASKKITSCDYEIRTSGPGTNVIITTTTLKVNGDLEVTGNTVYIDTVANTLNILDPNIVLNSSVSSPYPGNSGLIVNRGNDGNAAILWNETLNVWQLITNVADTATYTNIAITTGSGVVDDDIPLPDLGGATEVAQVGIGAGFPTTPPDFANIAFANVESGGGTRIYFNNGVENDELISKSKAIVYSIIF